MDRVLLCKKLNESVYGQNLAVQLLKDALITGQNINEEPSALLLFGWTGTGKSFVTRLIEEAFILQANVHKFSVPLHLSDEAYHYMLDDLLEQLDRSCGPVLFIFEGSFFNGFYVHMYVFDRGL